MRLIYTLLLMLALPVILLRLYLKPNPSYHHRIAERFAHYPRSPRKQLWLHCVSVGEFRAAKPLIEKIRREQPELHLFLSCTTPTASELIQRDYAADTHIHHAYFPYDLPHLIRRAIRRIQPNCIVLMETELWPNLIAQAQAWKVPVLLNNARLSERSYQRYHLIRSLLRPILSHLYVCAQSDEDTWRLQKLGVSADHCFVTGNLKYYQADDNSQIATLPADLLGSEHPIWIAASTHADEERLMLECQHRLRHTLPEARLVLAPRHPERRDEVAALVREYAYCPRLRSHNDNARDPQDVLIVDTLGELKAFYRLADMAVIGGSFIDHGGQNPLEALQQGCPVIFGPDMRNFHTIASEICAQGAGSMCERDDLAQALLQLWQDPERRRAELAAAAALIASRQEVLNQQYQHIVTLISDAVIGATPQARRWRHLRDHLGKPH